MKILTSAPVVVKDKGIQTVQAFSVENPDFDDSDYSFTEYAGKDVDGNDDYYSADGDDEYYNAFGKKKSEKNKSAAADKPAKDKKPGFFSKEKRSERKEGRKENRAVRKENRAVRRAERKAKYGARPLQGIVKGGVKKFKDAMPKLRKKKKADGTEGFEKINPDGSVIEVPANRVKKENGLQNGQEVYYDAADINTKKEVIKTTLPDGSVELSTEYTAAETEVIPNAAGVDEVYKKEDVVDADSPEATKGGMSKNMKTGLIIGGIALVVGVIIFAAIKMSNKSK